MLPRLLTPEEAVWRTARMNTTTFGKLRVRGRERVVSWLSLSTMAAFIARTLSSSDQVQMKNILRQQRGQLGATVTGTDPCSTGGHPNLSTEKKETPNEQVSVHYSRISSCNLHTGVCVTRGSAGNSNMGIGVRG